MIYIYTHKLFVYGTLRKDECNHFYLQGAVCLEPLCWTKGTLYDTGYGYPAMTCEEGRVWGELYLITDHQLAAVDELEDCHPDDHGEYQRIRQQVFTQTGVEEAYLYETCKDTKAMVAIPCGDWKKRS